MLFWHLSKGELLLKHKEALGQVKTNKEKTKTNKTVTPLLLSGSSTR